ncbi:MAG: glycosyltransferase [Xanthobacteraceae bacterium]|nr:glycosyltransferase [Xanthobacteraceae bacterium]
MDSSFSHALRRPIARIAHSLRRRYARTFSDADYRTCIFLVYQLVLGRPPDSAGSDHWLSRLRNGLGLTEFLKEVSRSDEAVRRRQIEEDPESDLSDGEFILSVSSLFLGSIVTPRDLAGWKRFLDEDPALRANFLHNLIRRRREVLRLGEAPYNTDETVILGSDAVLTREIWATRAAQRLTGPASRPADPPPRAHAAFRHTGTIKVSAITSLYRGGAYIEAFLENITAQSLFDQSELIIVDADSPDGEARIIEDYMRRFPNIVYKRINHRIGIYDAWNIGVDMARGAFLTNANLDDRRRGDSFALQAAALERHGFVDVVYQDFYYTYDVSLDFAQVAAMGFKSDLPILTANNLLQFNSPHNAPMWRKRLHDEVGLFDTSFQSAGDHEFWLRCCAAGKQFLKLNDAHVAYYVNPDGVSTHAETRGVEEGRRVQAKYVPLLISPNLLLSRRDFAREAGLALTADWRREPEAVVEDRLVAAAVAREAGRSAPRRALVAAPEPGIRLAIDGLCFQIGDSSRRRLWAALASALAARSGGGVVVLDRGDSPSLPGVEAVPFPSYRPEFAPADSLLIERFCRDTGVDVYLSSGYGAPVSIPALQVYDPASELARPDWRDHDLDRERKLALHFAAFRLCWTPFARQGLVQAWPELDTAATPLAPRGCDDALLRPRAAEDIAHFRRRRGLTRPFFLWWSAPQVHAAAKSLKIAKKAARDLKCDILVVGETDQGVAGPALAFHDGDEWALAVNAATALICVTPDPAAGPIPDARVCGCPVLVLGVEDTAAQAQDSVFCTPETLEAAMACSLRAPPRSPATAAGAAAPTWQQTAAFILAQAQQARAEAEAPPMRRFYSEWRRLRTLQSDIVVSPWA